ncbi:MAG: methylated-DNA--[protein]-cysteine S-methyltransferase [Ferruginibacter sp.]|nr:methylated-DNA--[protein]-cysteine S-methyltransferase [Ferruginibacter sp.]
MRIQTVLVESPLGKLVLKASADAVLGLHFFQSEKRPVAIEIPTNEEPQLQIVADTIQQLDEYFLGRRFNFDLPLQQEGSPFRQKVWAALLNIPYGRTISYMELSKRTGDAKAIRAVGTTNGANNISIIVPCHRVIGSNGSLTGYGGNLWRKQWLLEHENKFKHGVQTLF